MQDGLVGGIGECHGVEVVVLHELVEDVGTQHQGLGYAYLHVGDGLEDGMLLQEMVNEGDAATLASERAFADAGKVRESVETATKVLGHHATVLHLAVAHDGIEDDLAVLGYILIGIVGEAFEKLRQGEHGA